MLRLSEKTEGACRRSGSGAGAMIQITDGAARHIRKMLAKRNRGETGLRVGVKAGGCSGFEYIFGWETRAQGLATRLRGRRRRQGVRRSEEPSAAGRHRARLRHQPPEQGIYLQQPAREEHMRVRHIVQRGATDGPPGRGLRESNHEHVHADHRTAREPRVQVRLRHRDRAGRGAAGSQRGDRPADLGQEESRRGCSTGV